MAKAENEWVVQHEEMDAKEVSDREDEISSNEEEEISDNGEKEESSGHQDPQTFSGEYNGSLSHDND